MSIEKISLSGRKTEVVDKNMTFAEKIYFPAVIKGLIITIKHFFKKKATVQYPEQQREFSPVYRGQHVLMRDDQGRERCTACGLCALSCPQKQSRWWLLSVKKEKNICTVKKNMLRNMK